MNPFRIGERVTGAYFTNRTDELKRVLQALREPSRLLVYGPRRFGKSSVLEMAKSRAEADGVLVVKTDLGGATSTGEVAGRLATAFARALDDPEWGTLRDWVRALSLELQTDGAGLPILSLRLRPDEDATPRLEQILDRMDRFAEENERPVAVVLDEFQRIVELGPDQADWRLRELMQGHHHLSYVCAGSEEGVIEQLTARDGAFHGAFERLYIGSPPTGFEEWIDERLRDAGIADASGTGGRVVELAGPRTEDILKLARQVYFRAAAQSRCREEDPAAAMEEVVRADRGVFETLWDRRTTHQQNTLRAVASGAEKLTGREVRERFGLRTSAAVSQALDALERDGILARRGGSGRVRFEDPFFQAWVLRGFPPGL